MTLWRYSLGVLFRGAKLIVYCSCSYLPTRKTNYPGTVAYAKQRVWPFLLLFFEFIHGLVELFARASRCVRKRSYRNSLWDKFSYSPAFIHLSFGWLWRWISIAYLIISKINNSSNYRPITIGTQSHTQRVDLCWGNCRWIALEVCAVQQLTT